MKFKKGDRIIARKNLPESSGLVVELCESIYFIKWDSDGLIKWHDKTLETHYEVDLKRTRNMTLLKLIK